MKKLVLSLTMLLATGLSGFAYDLVVNNGDTAFFYYTITSEEEQTVELSKDSLVQTYYIWDGGESGPRETYKSMHVVIPETVTIDSKEYTVTALGDNVFRSYRYLADITLPKTLKTIGKSAFAYDINMRKVYVEDLEAWLRIERKWPVYMTDFALYDKNGNIISDVVIPETETEIANWKFMGVTGINKVTIPSSVKTVGIRAFKGSSVVEIDMADVETIGKEAFQECEKLEKVSFGNSLTEIPDDCFSRLNGDSYGYNMSLKSRLKTVVMGDAVKVVGARAFSGCYNLCEVTLSSSLEEIKERAFENCTALKDINAPDNLAKIGDRAFYYCPLKNAPFGNSISYIGTRAFDHCTGMNTPLVLGQDNDVTIGQYAFYYCEAVPSLVVGDAVTAIGDYAFCECNGVKSVTIGNSVKSIGEGAFYGLYKADEPLVIPNSVETIGEGAFASWMELTTLTIGSGVGSIGPEAFACSGVSKITSVTCLGKTPAKMFRNAFDTSTYTNATLTVPDGAGKAYSAANNWSLFDNIIDNNPDAGDDDGEYVREDVNEDGEVNSADVVKIYNYIIYGKGNGE